MKFVITGIAGHLGSQFATYLFENHPEVEVVGIDNLSCGYATNIPPRISLKINDLSSIKQQHLNNLIADADVVYHFAAYAAEGLSPFIRSYNYRNNLISTAKIVNACIENDVSRLVFTSSMAVYGNGRLPFDEIDTPDPIDPYGNAKLACERDIQIAANQHGLDYCIIRPHNVYGPYQSIWQRYRNVFGIWMARILNGETIQIYGDGEQQRAFSWIFDIVPCFLRAGLSANARDRTINLGGRTPITINRASQILSEIVATDTGTMPQIEYLGPRKEVKEAYCTTESSVSILDYQEKTSLRYGLRLMWLWAKKAWADYPKRRGTHLEELELRKGLYSFWDDTLEPVK